MSFKPTAALALLLLCVASQAPVAQGGRYGWRSLQATGTTTTPTTLVSLPSNDEPSVATVSRAPRRLQSSGEGYDMGGPAPICWKTYNGTTSRMARCNESVSLEFLTRPPNPMYSMQDYPTDYRFTINSTRLGHVAHPVGSTDWHIPHANIHSCVATVGFCTPLIGDTPGLSTHTATLLSNVTTNPQTGREEITFQSKIRLNPASYTIIAHIRWFTIEPVLNTTTNVTVIDRVRYDMATAMVRDVLPPMTILTVSKPVEYAMAGIIGLTCLFLFINMLFLIRYRHHKIMRFSQVNILMGMTVSGFIALCGVPLAAINTQTACSLRPWVTIIPLNFMFGLLFGKTWRIYRLMNNKQLKALKIKESWVVLVAFLLTVPELLIHGIYFIIAPPEMELENVMNEYTFIYECCGGDLIMNIFDGLHLAYAAIILILGCYVANKSASLATLFNEGKYIMFAIYTCSILAVIIVPASFAVATNPTTGYILRAMGICFAVAGTIGAINLPKIRLILSGVEITLGDNKTTNSRTSGTNATLAYASSSKTSSGAAAGGAPGACGGASAIVVKNHVPTAVMEKLGDALAAATKVSDRQKQGFALVRHDFEQCVEQVRLLNELLSRCVFAGGAGPSAPHSGPPPGAHASAKVAPAST